MNQHALKLPNVAIRGAARVYSYRHLISFEETNVVGNVYFSHHVSWQGRCRELFLRDYAPDVIEQLRGDLRLVTLSVGCEYFSELWALDEIEIRMSLSHLRQHRIGLAFDYFVRRGGAETLAARGRQEVGCMRQIAGGLAPTAVPSTLAVALAAFAHP
jgi:enediyne biosynthesis thioesterase